MKFSVLMIIILFGLTSWSYPYEEVKTMNVTGDGIEELKVDCGAGFLKMKGTSAGDIMVEAEIVVDTRSEDKAHDYLKKYMVLELKKKGRRAVLISKFEDDDRGFFKIFGSRGHQRVINLTVQVPENMNVTIDDGSGSIDVVNIKGELDIDDGSGSITVENIGGFVSIHDGSGEIEVTDVGDGLKIKDGSGTINVEKVNGKTSINDGSGEIKLTGVKGNVSVNDGSGGMRLREIIGDVEVDDGSGSINIRGVEGDVTIGEAGSGGVNIKDVSGKVVNYDED